MESKVGYHSYDIEILTKYCEASTGTLSVGQFDWGGHLPKSNGGAQRFPQYGWKSYEECKGRRELNCDTYRWSRKETWT